MKKNIWTRAALPALVFGLCAVPPQIQASAQTTQTDMTSTGSIVYENGAESVAVYAEDIACLKEKLSSVRAEVYNPGSYGNVWRREYKILPENAVSKEECPAPLELPAISEEVQEPADERTQKPEEISAPEEEEMPEQEKSPASGEETEELEETPAPEDTETPEQKETPAPEDTGAQESGETPAPDDTETREPEENPAPEDTETRESGENPAPEDTENKGGEENK